MFDLNKANHSKEQGSSLSDEERSYYLNAMGIQPWFSKFEQIEEVIPVEETSQAIEEIAEPRIIENKLPTQNVSQLDWQALQKTISQCQLCELHTTRTQTVFVGVILTVDF